MNILRTSLLLLLVAWGSLSLARESVESTPEPLAPPPDIVDSELLEPEVTIIEREDELVYEYRINGQVYMLRIQPRSGPAYYLLDLDGDGDMDIQGDDPAKIVVPHWVFFRW